MIITTAYDHSQTPKPLNQIGDICGNHLIKRVTGFDWQKGRFIFDNTISHLQSCLKINGKEENSQCDEKLETSLQITFLGTCFHVTAYIKKVNDVIQCTWLFYSPCSYLNSPNIKELISVTITNTIAAQTPQEKPHTEVDRHQQA